MGVMRPELVMKSIVPVVMAGVLGIYGLIIAVIISTGVLPPSSLPGELIVASRQDVRLIFVACLSPFQAPSSTCFMMDSRTLPLVWLAVWPVWLLAWPLALSEMRVSGMLPGSFIYNECLRFPVSYTHLHPSTNREMYDSVVVGYV